MIEFSDERNALNSSPELDDLGLPCWRGGKSEHTDARDSRWPT